LGHGFDPPSSAMRIRHCGIGCRPCRCDCRQAVFAVITGTFPSSVALNDWHACRQKEVANLFGSAAPPEMNARMRPPIPARHLGEHKPRRQFMLSASSFGIFLLRGLKARVSRASATAQAE